MFKFNPNTGVPGFRVGQPEDQPGFRINPDGSVPSTDPAAPIGYGFSPSPATLPASPAVQPAAAGDLECQGFAAGCQSGGDRGTTAEYYMGKPPRNLCVQCALRYLGLEDMPNSQQRGALEPWSIKR
jgi:hypothetical protein